MIVLVFKYLIPERISWTYSLSVYFLLNKKDKNKIQELLNHEKRIHIQQQLEM